MTTEGQRGLIGLSCFLSADFRITKSHYQKPSRDYTIWKLKFGTFILLLYICSRKCINNNERIMNNADFWASIRTIIAEGFTPEGLLKLDGYAEQFE